MVRKTQSSEFTGRWSMATALFMLIMSAIACGGDSSDDAAAELSRDSIHRATPEELGPAGETATAPYQARSGIVAHEHNPRHGGVVRSVDVYHIEVVSDPLSVWLYDRRGKPLPLDDVNGQVVVYSDDRRLPAALDPSDDRLVPVESIELPDHGTAFVELTVGKQPIDVALSLPLQTSGAAKPSDSH